MTSLAFFVVDDGPPLHGDGNICVSRDWDYKLRSWLNILHFEFFFLILLESSDEIPVIVQIVIFIAEIYQGPQILMAKCITIM